MQRLCILTPMSPFASSIPTHIINILPRACNLFLKPNSSSMFAIFIVLRSILVLSFLHVRNFMLRYQERLTADSSSFQQITVVRMQGNEMTKTSLRFINMQVVSMFMFSSRYDSIISCYKRNQNG